MFLPTCECFFCVCVCVFPKCTEGYNSVMERGRETGRHENVCRDIITGWKKKRKRPEGRTVFQRRWTADEPYMNQTSKSRVINTRCSVLLIEENEWMFAKHIRSVKTQLSLWSGWIAGRLRVSCVCVCFDHLNVFDDVRTCSLARVKSLHAVPRKPSTHPTCLYSGLICA